MIRLDFPGYSGEGSLEEISWEEWFEKFDESNLALMVQEQTGGGQKSNFNKLVSSDTAAESERGSSSSLRSNSGSRSASARRSEADEEELEASTDLDEDADADEELEEDLDVEEVTPVRASGAGNSRGRARQARTSTRRGTRAARSSSTARQSGGQAGRSRSPKRTAARGTSSKHTQAQVANVPVPEKRPQYGQPGLNPGQAVAATRVAAKGRPERITQEPAFRCSRFLHPFKPCCPFRP